MCKCKPAYIVHIKGKIYEAIRRKSSNYIIAWGTDHLDLNKVQQVSNKIMIISLYVYLNISDFWVFENLLVHPLSNITLQLFMDEIEL